MLPLSRVGNIKGKQQPSLLIMNKKLIQQLGEDSRKIQQTIHKQIGKPAEQITEADVDELTELFLSDQEITYLEGLVGLLCPVCHEGHLKLNNLRKLDLSNNQLSDISVFWDLRNENGQTVSIKRFKQLRELNLADNQLRDVSALARLKKLQILDLSGNQIAGIRIAFADSCYGLAPLSRLKKLEELNLQNNPDLPEEEIVMLQASLPQCKISPTPACAEPIGEKELRDWIDEFKGNPLSQ